MIRCVCMYICRYVCNEYIHTCCIAYTRLCISLCIHMCTCVCAQDNISDQVITKIQPYIDNEDFQPAAIFKVEYNYACNYCYTNVL